MLICVRNALQSGTLSGLREVKLNRRRPMAMASQADRRPLAAPHSPKVLVFGSYPAASIGL
jgi:hypothetical protein